MLSRRHIRIKVLQALYAFFVSGNDRLDLGEKELLRSIDKLRELYIYQFSLILKLVDFEAQRIEEAKKKFYPTEEDKNPNTKFINNKFVKQLSQNTYLKREIDKYKVSWAGHEDVIRKILTHFKSSQDFAEYIKKPEESYSESKEVITSLVKNVINESEQLMSVYEDMSIYWVDDFYLANLLIIKAISLFQENWNSDYPLPPLLKSNKNTEDQDEEKFIIDLYRKTIVRSEEFNKLIEEKAKNWDMDRIALMDSILIKMALAEVTGFEDIPIKVSINEYLEIAKYFSTSKSSIFINGIIDKIVIDMRAQKKFLKSGRGLID